jgi:small subunit ribosomal protein S13
MEKKETPNKSKDLIGLAEQNSARKQEFKAILRLADKEVKGEKPLFNAIASANGSSFMFANAIVKVLKLDKKCQVGTLSSKEIEVIEEAMKNPAKHGIPNWLFNRRKDAEDGEDKHLISSDLDLTKKFDIRRLRKIKCYVGMRHGRADKNLKVRVRGQRTRTTGRTGKTLGVVRKRGK